MKNNEFKELVDQNLSGLVWDERKRQKVLHALSEEEKPVKKVSTTFILIAAIVCLSVTALAAGLIFANRVTTQQIAEKAVYDQYGLTSTMLGAYFSPSINEKADSEATVVYKGSYYVLGDYTVEIKDKKATVSWSHDGEDTSGMFDAEAWGLEQLQEMVRIATTEHEISAFSYKALAIDEKHNNPDNRENNPMETSEQLGKEKAMAAAKAAGRSKDDLIALAKDAVTEAYALTSEQREKLYDPYVNPFDPQEPVDPEDVEDWFIAYYMKDEKPIFSIQLTLQQKEAGESDDYPPYTEKDGYYWVYINVETGIIEDIQYEPDLNSNG